MQKLTPQKTSKRSLRVLAAAAVASTVALAGCSSSPADSKDAQSADGSPEKLTVWHYYTLDNQLEMLNDYEQIFTTSHPDASVEFVYVPMDQLNSKLIAAAGAQTGPDIVVADGFNVGTLAAAEVLKPMGEYWANYTDADLFSEGALKMVGDDLYGVQGHVNSLALWANMDILNEAGASLPTTMEELEAAMKASVDAGYSGITLSGDPTIQGAFQGYPWWTAEGFNFENRSEESLANAFARVRGWVDDGLLSPQVATWDQNVAFAEFMAGQTAFSENGNWQISDANENAPFEFAVVPLPLGDTGKIYLGGESQSIGVHSKNADLAWDFLEETYLSYDGQIIAVSAVGSIPTRSDALDSEVITDDAALEAFSVAIAEQGAAYPDAILPSEHVEKILLASAQGWSSALAGAESPESAAAGVVQAVTPLISE